MNRVVWDPFGDTAFLVDADGHMKELSGRLGRILDRLRSADPAEPESVRREFPEACTSLERAGLASAEHCRYVRIERSPHLKRVQIELTGRCNLSCSYCFSSKGGDSGGGLASDQVLDLLDSCDELGVLGVDFTGGEPLLDPHWRTYVERARSFGMAVNLQSNGTLIDDDAVRFMEAQSVSGIQISIDSHLEQANDSSRGTEGAFTAAHAGIDRAHSSKVPVQITLMMHEGNVDHVVDSIRYYSTRFRRSVVNVDRVVGKGKSRDVVPLSAEAYWRALRPYIARNVRPSKVCETPGYGPGEPACGVGYSLAYITADGEIAACPTLTSRDGAQFAGPNLAEYSLSKAWHDSEVFTGFRYTNCEAASQCAVGKQCGGGCRSNAYLDLHSITAPDAVECNMRKNSTAVWIDFPQRYKTGRYEAVDD